jgi:S-methylmethionine-dependent homocysteine/selenocysteine methylase
LKISGETYNVACGWQGKKCCKPVKDYTEEWISLGARVVGGCYRVSSGNINAIKEKVKCLNMDN